jgi:hypothetical protein
VTSSSHFLATFRSIPPNVSSTRQWELHNHSRQVEEHSHSPTYCLWRHGILGEGAVHRMRRGEGSRTGRHPRHSKTSVKSLRFLGLTGVKRSIKHAAAAPREASANWSDPLRDRSLCCSHASSCALKPLFVAVISVHIRIRRPTPY